MSTLMTLEPAGGAGTSSTVSSGSEVQKHGFIWEKEMLLNIYRATENEIKELNYTGKVDLPARLNRLDGCDVSIKTSGSKNTICMADVLRVFDCINSGEKFHMVVIHYKQDGGGKRVDAIVELDLTSATSLLFGTLTRAQIQTLVDTIKKVPQNRKPTPEEHQNMYRLRNELQCQSGAIKLNIKCNSTQSRLQCSFNKFRKFMEDNPTRVVASSDSCSFRGGCISETIISPRRTFKEKP